jgi:hypothetical protein
VAIEKVTGRRRIVGSVVCSLWRLQCVGGKLRPRWRVDATHGLHLRRGHWLCVVAAFLGVGSEALEEAHSWRGVAPWARIESHSQSPYGITTR